MERIGEPSREQNAFAWNVGTFHRVLGLFRGPGDYFQRLKEVVAGIINMFITIYYGDQKSLLFNPSCSVINLLNSIKERCGYGDTDRVLDLTDETGNGGYTTFDNFSKLNTY